MCEWTDRWAQLQLPLHSSRLRPPTNRLRLHSRRSHGAGTFTEERKRRKAPNQIGLLRKATSLRILSFDVPDPPSRSSCVSFARNPCVPLLLLLVLFLASTRKIPLVTRLRQERRNYNTCEDGRDAV